MLFATCKPDAHSVGIRAAIERQLAAYPESTLQDVYKSFYQEHFGPEHMIADTTSARRQNSPKYHSATHFEPLGNTILKISL